MESCKKIKKWGGEMSDNNRERKNAFEFQLCQTLEQYYVNFFAPINYRDVYRFSPNAYTDFMEKSRKKNIDNSMLNDCILYLDTDDCGNNYYLDSESGLIFYIQDNSCYVTRYGNFSSQHDILDAAYFRRYISDESFRNRTLVFPRDYWGEITTSHYMAYNFEDIFTTPILKYTAMSMDDLKSIILEITNILSSSKFFQKLWFRGQRQEYLKIRSPKTVNKLGLKRDYEKMPYLVPSLGRYITKENFETIKTNMLFWLEAFKIWTLTQSKKFENEFAIDSPLYKEIVKCIEPFKMAEFMNKIPYDISEYIYFQHELEEMSEILSMQQYGGYTSMLDITDDLDVALFFTQSYLNENTQKYEICNPNSENVIYVFAQGRNTCTIDISEHMFKNATNDGIHELPLRIANQRCGLMIGANLFARNTYAYRIVAKIKLNSMDILTTKKVDEMFPNIKMDSLYKTYYDIEPKLKGLYG